MTPRAASMNSALTVVTSRTSLPTSLISRVVVSTVSPRPENVSAICSRSPTNSSATTRNVSRPSSIRSAICTASAPASMPPWATSGADPVPARIWRKAEPSSPSVSTAATESVRTSECRSSRTRIRTWKRPPGAGGMTMSVTSPAGRPDRRTSVPTCTPVTLPKSATTSKCSVNSCRRSPIMNNPTANSSSPPTTNAPTSAKRGEPIMSSSLGLRPKPHMADASGDPIAPRKRLAGAARCAAWGRTPPRRRPPPYFTVG